MKRADWVRPLLEMLEGQARRAGQAGLSSGQKALAAHLFDIIINEVSCLKHNPIAGIQAKLAVMKPAAACKHGYLVCYMHTAYTTHMSGTKPREHCFFAGDS